jgi:hypothetical protein
MCTKICSRCKEEKKVCEFRKISKNEERYNTYCRECEKIYKQEYFQKNKEKHLKRKQQRRLENPEKYREETKKYYEKTKDIQFVKKKKWISENREKYNSYWTNRKKEDQLFKLITDVRSRISTYLKNSNYKKKSKTFDIVGCSPEFLKEHLEKQFVDGMSWENRNEWHIDHIIPLSSAKTEDDALRLCHYTNLQPLWAEDNLKKSNKIL